MSVINVVITVIDNNIQNYAQIWPFVRVNRTVSTLYDPNNFSQESKSCHQFDIIWLLHLYVSVYNLHVSVRVCGWVCVKGKSSATERQPCVETAPCVSCDCCLIPPAATETTVSSWRRDIAPLSLLLLLPLISLSFPFLSSPPRAVSYCALLSIWSLVTAVLSLQVCACVCLSQIKFLLIFGAGDHFKCQPAFLAVPNVTYYTMSFLLKAENAILPVDGANGICDMCELMS